MNVIKVNRRQFVKIAGAASAGLVVALQLPRAHGAEGKSAPAELGPFVHVGTDGTITVYVSKSEMGQGVRTTLPMIVAEEMDADWKSVRIVQADLDKKYGPMGTGGSSSIRTMWMPLRRAGATARAMLVAAAAAKWNVPASEVTVANGVVSHGANKAAFGQLAAAASKLDVPKDVPLEDPSKFTIIGRKANGTDNPDLVRGKGTYGIDVKVPGMLYGAVLRSPVFGAKVVSFDDTKAKAMPGVRAVVKIDPRGSEFPWAGVGVVADSTWAALRARDALDVKWDEGAAVSETSASLRSEMTALTSKAGKRARDEGNVDSAMISSFKRLEATYEVPYLAHATMEPMNATVSVKPGGAEIWAPTQFPDWAGGSVAAALGLKPEQIKVHVTLLGGGFGRRAFPDPVLEAAMLSKAVGAPVKVQWTREDDIQHDFYRPAGIQRVMAGLDNEGRIVAWRHRMSAPSINAWMGGQDDPAESETGGLDDLPLAIPNFRLEFALARSAVPRGWWRSVENSANAFVVNAMLDELAHAAEKDPIDFHLALLPPGKKIENKNARAKDYPFQADRLRRVIETVRDRSGWAKAAPAGRARGFAAWYSFLTYVAEVAEVSVEGGAIKVHRMTAAIDCGQPVNPDGIAAQVEGAIVYGLSAALGGAITIDKGRVQQSNFHDYPLLTIADMPAVDLDIVPSKALPTGTGEPGLPPAAPAVANAVFKLTGKRLRTMPFKLG
jgi:isoquinoline 1-oxidoreductase beta subunit